MKQKTKKIVVASMLLCLGYVLPFFTGQIPQIGNMLLPMHIPVILCGMICGWQYGAVTGFILPITRSLIFGMPVFYPISIYMSFELLTYGLVSGLIYKKTKTQNYKTILISLVSAMLSGRIVYGVIKALIMGIDGEKLVFTAFISSAFIEAIPGIIIQLVFIPLIILSLQKTGLSFTKKVSE